MSTETNRAIAYFTHEGERYKIHERSNPLHNGTRSTRRFVVRLSDGASCGHLERWGGVREARKIIDERTRTA